MNTSYVFQLTIIIPKKTQIITNYFIATKRQHSTDHFTQGLLANSKDIQ